MKPNEQPKTESRLDVGCNAVFDNFMRQYNDMDGNPVTIDVLVRNHPEWAANQIRHRDQLERENERLLEREKMCETMDKAEKLALIRALQEIRDAVGLLGDGVSPREIVAAVISLSNVRKAEDVLS